MNVTMYELNRLRDLGRIECDVVGESVVYSISEHLDPHLDNCRSNEKDKPFYLDPCPCRAKNKEVRYE